MLKLIVVAGLPGSGKSVFKRKYAYIKDRVYDDYHANAVRNSTAIEDAWQFPFLKGSLDAEKDCMILEVAYCWHSRREYLKKFMKQDYPRYFIEWHFFENNLRQCFANIVYRNRKSLAKEIELAYNVSVGRYCEKYTIPDKCYVHPVWDVPKITDEEYQAVVDGLKM